MYVYQNQENPMTVRMKFISTGRLVAVTIVLTFDSLAFHIPLLKRKVRAIQKSPKQEHVADGLWEIGGDQPLQSRITKDLITEVGNNEIFEYYETSWERQSPGIVYCTCRKCMQPAARNRQYNKDRHDSLSIPGYVIKKNQSRGSRHGQSTGQMMYHKARATLRRRNFQWRVRAILFWKDGTQMQTIKSRCLMKVGQRRKSYNTTHLPWKTMPMKLQLKKGDDGKRTALLFWTKEYKVRWDKDLIFVQTGHPFTTHICAVQSVHKRGTHRTRLAQGLQCRLCAPEKESVIWCRTCLTLRCSLTCREPRAHHLPHSLFLLPRHQNTQHNRNNTIYSQNNQDIMNTSRLSQPTSSAIKNHSGVKTCRVAETRARQLPQVMSPKSLRLSRGSKTILEIHIN